jgi:hypothetical protein
MMLYWAVQYPSLYRASLPHPLYGCPDCLRGKVEFGQYWFPPISGGLTWKN